MATAVDQKLLRQTKFPPEFSQKVDMKKVNIEVMKKWIAGKISDSLGSEDDVVIELCFNLLEGSRFPDIKALQISLTGFLDKDTPKFCKDLWNLCLSAQSNPQGVPKELLEAKKLELIQEKVGRVSGPGRSYADSHQIDAEKAAAEVQQRKDQEQTRERDVDAIRQRERGERGRGRGGRGRGGRDFGGRDFDSRRPRFSRSPPPRRRSPFRGGPPRRDADTWSWPRERVWPWTVFDKVHFQICFEITITATSTPTRCFTTKIWIKVSFTKPITGGPQTGAFKKQEQDELASSQAGQEVKKELGFKR
ncbi:hypothetical protein LTS07_001870 [Exophiala sideris]|uniref:PWI domain-containing protein n=1 Tax=Exophiala sideris TaxID=1016849 RepID=A0ABR0JKN9_9EURO|nr:hypothetical protein LTR13_007364 [Exophiala sideris]KAK5036145.1 hypothetical protein LTS07_001870 [Exophiala sideris]KAK5066528.1 hypothetical protein LTR69_001874 [Exophiala sideris]KAK5180350.1 hypothetical protein LTR44_007107 [Eurotiomycetes sp. CCFEE 6388]